MSRAADRLNLSLVVGVLTIVGVLVGAGITYGKHAQRTAELERRMEKIEQVFSLTHPDTSKAFGVRPD